MYPTMNQLLGVPDDHCLLVQQSSSLSPARGFPEGPSGPPTSSPGLVSAAPGQAAVGESAPRLFSMTNRKPLETEGPPKAQWKRCKPTPTHSLGQDCVLGPVLRSCSDPEGPRFASLACAHSLPQQRPTWLAHPPSPHQICGPGLFQLCSHDGPLHIPPFPTFPEGDPCHTCVLQLTTPTSHSIKQIFFKGPIRWHSAHAQCTTSSSV